MKPNVQREYYDNGQLRYEFPRLDDHLHGIVRKWNMIGQLMHEVSYLNGERHGLMRGLNTRGERLYESYYDHGAFVTQIPEGIAYPLEEHRI